MHLLAAIFSAMTLLVASTQVNAAIIPTVPLATSANFSVLGGQTVTNTGNSVLNLDVGVYPGSSLTGFPPGVVNAPGVQQIANAIALQAQSDLTIAYDNAAGRTLDQTLPSISNVTVIGGAYAITAKGPLDLTGTLTLDGQNDPTSVFIFQTDSSLTTASREQCLADQRGPGVQRLLADRQLGSAGYRLRHGRQHHGPHLDQPGRQRHRPWSCPRPQRFGDVDQRHVHCSIL